MQKVKIKDFGPITECEFDIKDFILFIGPQAVGKSTICKCIYFFKLIRDEFYRYILDCMNSGKDEVSIYHFEKSLQQRFYSIFGKMTHSRKETYMHFEYNTDVYAELKPKGSSNVLEVTFSRELEAQLQMVATKADIFIKNLSSQKGTSKDIATELIEIESKRKAYMQSVRNTLNSLFNDDRELLYIPASRSLLAGIENYLMIKSQAGLIAATPTTISNETQMDYFNHNFISRITYLRDVYRKTLKELIQDKELEMGSKINKKVLLAERLISVILKGEYKFVQHEDRIYLSSGKKEYVSLRNSSSGQQESLWILYIIFSHLLNDEKVFMVIEEPEAHIYPVAQREMVKLIALLSNSNKSQVLITTHSPYILTSLNNLLYANKLGKTKGSKAAKIVEKELWLDITRTSAFMLKDVEGKYIQDIIDEETQLIAAEEIDTVSSLINEEYDKLYELED